MNLARLIALTVAGVTCSLVATADPAKPVLKIASDSDVLARVLQKRALVAIPKATPGTADLVFGVGPFDPGAPFVAPTPGGGWNVCVSVHNRGSAPSAAAAAFHLEAYANYATPAWAGPQDFAIPPIAAGQTSRVCAAPRLNNLSSSPSLEEAPRFYAWIQNAPNDGRVVAYLPGFIAQRMNVPASPLPVMSVSAASATTRGDLCVEVFNRSPKAVSGALLHVVGKNGDAVYKTLDLNVPTLAVNEKKQLCATVPLPSAPGPWSSLAYGQGGIRAEAILRSVANDGSGATMTAKWEWLGRVE